jgi:hypothetical protein
VLSLYTLLISTSCDGDTPISINSNGDMYSISKCGKPKSIDLVGSQGLNWMMEFLCYVPCSVYVKVIIAWALFRAYEEREEARKRSV